VLAFALAMRSRPGSRPRSRASRPRLVLTGAALVFAGGMCLPAFSHSYLSLYAARIVMAWRRLYAAPAQATAVAISEPHHRGSRPFR